MNRRPVLRYILILVAVLQLEGCAPTKDSTRAVGATGTGIVGGEVINEKNLKAYPPASFMARIELTPEAAGTEFPQVHCSGIFIHPQVVLTAAHCVTTESNQSYPTEELVIFTNGSRRALGVSAISVHPKFVNVDTPCPFGPCSDKDLQLSMLPNDVALVKLITPNREIPLSPPRWKITDTANQLLNAETLIGLGFGQTKPRDKRIDPYSVWDAKGFAHLSDAAKNKKVRELAKRAQLETGTLKVLRGQLGYLIKRDEDKAKTFKKIPFSSPDGESLCEGDSGGPIFSLRADQWTLIGLVSHPMGTSNTTPCGGTMTGLTDLASHSSWIRDELARILK